MKGLLSIITPVGPGALAYLPAAAASVAGQELPVGWAVEWLIQHDGGTVPELERVLPAVGVRLSLGANRRGGPATTRNMALGRARGSLVKVLDADDRLTAGALARDIAGLTCCRARWAVSSAVDVWPDGTTARSDADPAPGQLPAGALLAHWEAHDFRLPVHPATLCAETALVVMLGGWTALPSSEDTGLVLALDAVSAGWFTPEVGLLYRKSDGQMTASAGHVDPAERSARLALVGRRARLLRAARPAWTAHPDQQERTSRRTGRPVDARCRPAARQAWTRSSAGSV